LTAQAPERVRSPPEGTGCAQGRLEVLQPVGLRDGIFHQPGVEGRAEPARPHVGLDEPASRFQLVRLRQHVQVQVNTGDREVTLQLQGVLATAAA
jgi:hypothetical protein